jgi:hypothetical protein
MKHLAACMLAAMVFAGCGQETREAQRALSPNTDCRSASDCYATVAWDANPADQQIQGYKLHWGTESGDHVNTVDVGNVTTFKLTGLKKRSYCFAVTAYSATEESPKSDEKCHSF